MEGETGDQDMSKPVNETTQPVVESEERKADAQAHDSPEEIPAAPAGMRDKLGPKLDDVKEKLGPKVEELKTKLGPKVEEAGQQLAPKLEKAKGAFGQAVSKLRERLSGKR
jgi:hypothetical protein